MKSLFKDVAKRGSNQSAFKNINDHRFIFMEKFVTWVKAWRNLNLNHGHFTKDTSQAIIQATTALIKIINFVIEKLKVQYVLPGKFQTDCLEKRFSLYRQLSGCNYQVSVQQVLESETKHSTEKC